jgi:hypothetical protein
MSLPTPRQPKACNSLLCLAFQGSWVPTSPKGFESWLCLISCVIVGSSVCLQERKVGTGLGGSHCNPSYSRGWRFKISPGKSETLSQKDPSQKRAGRVAQGVGPEFKPLYRKNK